ncbi:MAG: hypothetical protein HYU39_01570 [Thaumarchaeota archaeon]|nr:hypothetical protein [Nitrososphaerota archaeon]
MSILQTIIGWFGSNGKHESQDPVEQAPPVTVTPLPPVEQAPIIKEEAISEVTPVPEVKLEAPAVAAEVIPEPAPPIVEPVAPMEPTPVQPDTSITITTHQAPVRKTRRNGGRRRKSASPAAA